MNEETPYKNISYTFYVQSVEDFYKQLQEYEQKDRFAESEFDTNDLTLAQDMLKSIGVNV